MWKIYAKDNRGIAIVTDFRTFRDVLPQVAQIQRVDYVDFQNDTAFLDENEQLNPFLLKRIEFKHENEIRAILFEDAIIHSPSCENIVRYEYGIGVPVSDIVSFIRDIYIAPDASQMTLDFFATFLKRFGLDNRIRRSAPAIQPYRFAE